MSSDHTREITAFFDSREKAEAAVEKLLSLNIEKDAVLVAQAAQDPESEAATKDMRSLGLIATLFLTNEDRALVEGVLQDGYIVSVDAVGLDEDAVAEILKAEARPDATKPFIES